MMTRNMEDAKVLYAFFTSVFIGKMGIPGPWDMRGILEQGNFSLGGGGSG